jgi:hypothetical protein
MKEKSWIVPNIHEYEMVFDAKLKGLAARVSKDSVDE